MKGGCSDAVVVTKEDRVAVALVYVAIEYEDSLDAAARKTTIAIRFNARNPTIVVHTIMINFAERNPTIVIINSITTTTNSNGCCDGSSVMPGGDGGSLVSHGDV